MLRHVEVTMVALAMHVSEDTPKDHVVELEDHAEEDEELELDTKVGRRLSTSRGLEG